MVARQASQPRQRSVAADLVEETIAYFPYSDVKGARLADRGKPQAPIPVAYFHECFEIRGGVIVWTTRPPKHFHIDVTITIIVALTTKPPPCGAR